MLIAAALSHTAGLVPLTLLPPARREGASYEVGLPSRDALAGAGILAATGAVVVGLLGDLPPLGIGLMLVLSYAAGRALTRLSARLIGGQTGDVAGAVQQAAEILALLGLLVTVER